MFHDFIAIGFQAAIEIMQMNACNHACRRIEQFCRKRFGQRVVTFLFPPRNHIVPLDGNHSVKFRNFIGTVLQIGIHRNDHIALRPGKTGMQCRRFSIITTEFHSFQTRIFGFKRLYHPPRIIGTPVIDKYDFVSKAVRVHDSGYPCRQFGQRLSLIVQRNDYGYIHDSYLDFWKW